MSIEIADARAPSELRRILTFWPLVFYGLGVIVGAGIYVALGSVMERAGAAAPVSFLLAGTTAGLTGLCYAEMAGRYPEAAGSAAYVRHGFRSDWLAVLVGIAITAAVAVAAASIARGAVEYLTQLLRWDDTVLTVTLVLASTALASFGVKESVGVAALIGALEILGLLAAIAVALIAAPDYHLDGIFPVGVTAWLGTLSGAFIAFFAFIGFETLANLAEEVKEPTRTVPRGILGAIAVSVLLYCGVALATVLSDQSGHNPLLGLFTGRNLLLFAAVGFLSVANGVLVEIVMLSRLFYGMSKNHNLPRALTYIHPTTRTPLVATTLAGAIVLAVAWLVPFQHLLIIANALTLGIFILVDLALVLVHARESKPRETFSVPRWVPPLAVLLTGVLFFGEFVP